MKSGKKQQRKQRGSGPASRAGTRREADPGSSRASDRQGRLIHEIDNSRAMTVQRRQLERSFNQPLQRQEEEELQMQQPAVQRQEEEEELQMMQAPMQLQEEDEELLQGKFESVQRQAPEEEELMQGRFESMQREPLEEEEPLQGKSEPVTRPGQQTSAQPNRTGMPDNLKAGIEALSGQDLSGVRVHYNSPRPKQFNALAYAQGNEIHLGSGQEKHLPHEAWHTVQQREGRVEPTTEMGGEKINDDGSLEREADIMGARAIRYPKK